METRRVLGELDKGNIVIVAGFQGMTTDMETTTLGRGGSDTTAVALAAALKAERCEIYTDVPGVFTADPRVVPNARKLVDLSFEEMLELASYGAGVLHPRSVELGAFYGIPILVASSFSSEPGTLIHGGEPMESRNRLSGIAHDLDTAKITVMGIPDRPGIAASLFEPLARAGISVDTIVQNAGVDNITDLTFTVSRRDLAASQEIVRPVAENLGGQGIVANAELGKVSIVGNGMQDAPGYAARMFTALHRAGINIQMITTSEIRITCIVDRANVTKAVPSPLRGLLRGRGGAIAFPESGPLLSVIVPAFNEEARIGDSLSKITAWLARQTYSWEVIVVDDGSSDSTALLVTDASLPNPGCSPDISASSRQGPRGACGDTGRRGRISLPVRRRPIHAHRTAVTLPPPRIRRPRHSHRLPVGPRGPQARRATLAQAHGQSLQSSRQAGRHRFH